MAILIADEIKDGSHELMDILKREGHEALETLGGVSIFNTAKNENADLILIRFNKLSDSTEKIIRKIKSDNATKNIPIILVASSNRKTSGVAKAIKAGAEEYITKPFNNSELLIRVNSMLRYKNLSDRVSKADKLIEEEMKLAHKAQSSLLPTEFPYPENVLFYAKYLYTGAVGGDYYDVIDYGDGNIGLVVADASGHGPSAAVMVSLIKALLGADREAGKSPLATVRKLNKQILKLTSEERFLSIFLGLYNINSKVLEYVSCGHPYPLILRKKNMSIERILTNGEFVGIHNNFQAKQGKVKLNTGDRLLAYSDGLIEACDDKYSFFGFDGLEKSLRDRFDQGGDNLLEGLMKDVTLFSEHSQFTNDDMAILMMDVI